MVRRPSVFLMDEPLSNLDAKLRVQMRAELKRFHQELGATILYVTHDQVEAVTMADKMAVMNGGVLQQYGPPKEIYDRPVNTCVAGFVGSPAMNLIRARVTSDERSGEPRLQGASGWSHPLSAANARVASASTGDVIVGIRHGHIRISTTPEPQLTEARVYTVEPTGDITYVHVLLGDQIVVASIEPFREFEIDQRIWIEFDQNHLHLFDATTEQRLSGADTSARPTSLRQDGAAATATIRAS
jgi:multiple sugar transport system ATP-binding protein